MQTLCRYSNTIEGFSCAYPVRLTILMGTKGEDVYVSQIEIQYEGIKWYANSASSTDHENEQAATTIWSSRNGSFRLLHLHCALNF